MLIFRYLYKLFKTNDDITTNYADPDVLLIRQIAVKVNKERHNIMQFVRFNVIEQQNIDEIETIYFALIEPKYDALPLTIDFFKDRFADQKWAIYDKQRKYGYFYDLKTVELISIEENMNLLVGAQINEHFFTKDEVFFQTMWNRYCQALTIKERINPKRQRQHMPIRFWQYLPEMKNSDKNN